jgi:hypothetical protein
MTAYDHNYILNDIVYPNHRALFSSMDNILENHNVIFNPISFDAAFKKQSKILDNKEIERYLEPKETLEELYKQRAQQLRDTYDYIALMFSGGNDSNNILNVFRENNIFLDEIVSLQYSANESIVDILEKNYVLGGFGHEIKRSAYPLAQEYLQYSPKTKFTLIDRLQLYKKLYNNTFTDNHIISDRNVIDPHALIRKYHISWQKSWTDMISRNKKICFLYACEKVALEYDPADGFYIYFSDINFRRHVLDDSTELFYTHPTCVSLLIKQAYEIIKHLHVSPLITRKLFGSMSKYEKTILSKTRKIEEEYAKIFYKTNSSKFLTLKEGDKIILRNKTDLYNRIKNITIVPRLLEFSNLFESNLSSDDFLTIHICHLLFEDNDDKEMRRKFGSSVENVLFSIKTTSDMSINQICRKIGKASLSKRYYINDIRQSSM